MLGLEGGGVGKIARSGITLYRPSLDLKSWILVKFKSLIESSNTYRYPTTCTYSSSSNNDLFVRLREGVGNVLESSLIAGKYLAQRHFVIFGARSYEC